MVTGEAITAFGAGLSTETFSSEAGTVVVEFPSSLGAWAVCGIRKENAIKPIIMIRIATTIPIKVFI
jgi:hypothetical protein